MSILCDAKNMISCLICIIKQTSSKGYKWKKCGWLYTIRCSELGCITDHPLRLTWIIYNIFRKMLSWLALVTKYLHEEKFYYRFMFYLLIGLPYPTTVVEGIMVLCIWVLWYSPLTQISCTPATMAQTHVDTNSFPCTIGISISSWLEVGAYLTLLLLLRRL